jgi:protein-tyrosine phosphatase
MQVILGWIDGGLRPAAKVFVHCLSGRGRTGTVIGCWLARHGIAQGESVIDRLIELRQAAGLIGPCPETAAQRELATRWRVGQ